MDEVPLWALAVLQILIIILNALLVLSQVSVSSLSDGKVKKLAEDGDKDAIDMLHVDSIEKKLHAAISVALALVNTVGCVLITNPLIFNLTNFTVDAVFDNDVNVVWQIVTAAIYFMIVIAVTMLFGYFIPKNTAKSNYTEDDIKIHRMSAYRLYIVLKPAVWFLLTLSEKISKIFGETKNEAVSDVTEDEILLMVDAVEESGAIESSEKQMIENVFSFSTTTASMVMTHRTNVIAISSDASPEDILDTVIKAGKSRFPVYDGDIDHIVGILMARDYLINLYSPNPKAMSELLRKPYIVPGSIRINALFKNMQLTNTHIAVVVDEYGGTGGIVTLEDLLEELVGNIYDELDQNTEKTDIIKQEENVWRVAGDVELETLSETLLTDLPEDEDYDTVGGMVLSKLTSIPNDGEHPEVFVNGLYIYVEEVKNRRIMWTRVSLVMTVEEEKENDE